MRNHNDHNDYDLRDEYDLSEMRIVAKGRYARHRRTGKNVILPDPDVSDVFPTDEVVNEALRLVMRISEIPDKYKANIPGV